MSLQIRHSVFLVFTLLIGSAAPAGSLCSLFLKQGFPELGRFKPEFQAGLVALQEAAPVTVKYFEQLKGGRGIDVKMKDSSGVDPFTIADTKANEIIVRRLKKEFPDDLVVVEESMHKIHPHQVRSSKRIWYVDPLDGTKEFLLSSNEWAIQVGLSENGRPVFGMVFQPMTQKLWFAALGYGAYEIDFRTKIISRIQRRKIQREVIQVSSRTNVPGEEALAILDKLNARPDWRITKGSVGVKMDVIVKGDADFYVADFKKASRWDTCAPEIIAEEAGLKLVKLIRLDNNRWLPQHIDYHSPNFTNDFVFVLAPPELIQRLEEI